MARLVERLSQVDLSVTSPSGLITLRAGGDGALAVTIPRGALRGWDAAGLAREVEAVIDAGLREARRAYARVRGELRTPRSAAGGDAGGDAGPGPAAAGPGAPPSDPPDPWPGGPPDPPPERRGGEPPRPWDRVGHFREAVDRIEVRGVSRLGHLRVTRDEDHRFQVHVAPAAVGRLSEREVTEEIHTALVDALTSYQHGYAQAHRAAFDGLSGEG